jgi:phosphonopyruvate decarboxylase
MGAPADAPIVATTGFTSRELWSISKREQNFLQVGSMGCVGAIAMGIALSSDRTVIAVDGDGAAMMKLGVMAMIGSEQSPNLVHILLDNGVNESTGGQESVLSGFEFSRFAQICRYRQSVTVTSITDFSEAFRSALLLEGPSFICVKIAPGGPDALPRPDGRLPELRRRFQAAMLRRTPRAQDS